MKSFSPAADRNKEPIKEVLSQYIKPDTRLLEIGSGSAQHAIYLADYFEATHWVCSDVSSQHHGIKENLKQAKLKNVHGPEKLEVGKDDFPGGVFDYVYTANTLHIMSWKNAKTLFKLLGKRLRENTLVFIYGPFNYGGEFTSPSNESFNESLKQKNEKSGIRNFEDVKAGLEKVGFELVKDHEMPANNRLLVFKRLKFKSI